jgi:hypothetical protein
MEPHPQTEMNKVKRSLCVRCQQVVTWEESRRAYGKKKRAQLADVDCNPRMHLKCASSLIHQRRREFIENLC